MKEKERIPLTVSGSPVHQIPQGYNINTVVVMPVNPGTGFVYWEITDKLLNGSRKKLKDGSARLMMRVSEAGCGTELCSFELKQKIGQKYINYLPALRPLVAEVGILDRRGFSGLVKSRNMAEHSSRSEDAGYMKQKDPAARLSMTEHETWMTKTSGAGRTVRVSFSGKSGKQSGVIEHYRRTAPRSGPSSAGIRSGSAG